MRYTEIENLENEEWRPVAGYEGRYFVSNYGRVKSFLTMGNCRKVGAEHAHLLKPKKNSCGYLRVALRANGKTTDASIHRLVAAAFIGELPQGMVVNHKDGDKTNNHVSNLEIITQSGNRSHAVRTGLLKGAVKQMRAIAVMKDGQTVGEYESLTDAAKDLGLARQHIFHVLSGERKTHKGYTFKYL